MKKADLEKRIAKLAKQSGVNFEYVGGTRHDKWKLNGRTIMIPRHTEIGETLAKEILKQAQTAIDG
jgi:hypothetical protein